MYTSSHCCKYNDKSSQKAGFDIFIWRNLGYIHKNGTFLGHLGPMIFLVCHPAHMWPNWQSGTGGINIFELVRMHNNALVLVWVVVGSP